MVRSVLAVVIVAGTSACTAEARAARHLERADEFFDQKKYREAILEYRNVVEAQPDNAQAQGRLGIAHFELAELGQAYRHLQRASELDPGGTDVRWRLGVLHSLSGQKHEARRHAEAVLQKDPNHLEALLLYAETAAGAAELDEAVTRVQAVRDRVPDREKASRVLGSLYLRKRDLAKAEEAFQDAVDAAPQSVEAHTSLGTLHLARGQVALAEKEFRAASDAAPAGSPARMRLADFYIAQGRTSDARQVLTDLTAKEPDYTPAWLRLAEVSIAEQKHEEADQTLDTVLSKNPRNTHAQMLRAQVRLAQGQTDEATRLIQRAITDEPRFAPAHYQLALAHLQSGNDQQARAALRTAVTLEPAFVPAALRLAELNVEAGVPDAAIEDLGRLLEARPGVPRAYELLGAAYLKKGDSARAAEVYQKFQQTVPPSDPRASYYAGLTLRQQGKRAEARKAFHESLARLPGAPDPLGQLVEMAFEDKQPEAALELARRQAQAAPRSAPAQHVLGLVHHRRGELPQAEAAHRRALGLDPRHTVARLELAKIQVATGRLDGALAELDKVLEASPKSADAWQLYGLAQLQKSDVARAQEAFRKVLAINPRSAPAANNLAWIYSEHGGDLEEALRLAQLAKESAPDDPYVSDTLGWLFYKRGIYQRALALLKDSAAKRPDSAQVHFHLGMTYQKLGDKAAARLALTRALELDGQFTGAEDARRALGEL